MGCDPSDRPTADYIARHANAYNNPNLTTWEAAGNTFPVSIASSLDIQDTRADSAQKNRLIDGCSQ